MHPIKIAGPAVEPVGLAEIRADLALAEDETGQDGLITDLLEAARLLVEASAGVMLIDQTWRLTVPVFPRGGVLRLPLRPVSAVTAVSVDGTPRDPASARLTPGADPPVLHLEAAAGEVTVDLVVGFGPSPRDVPAPLRLAVRRLVARWFEHRGDEAAPYDGLPADLAALVAPWRRVRL